MTDLDLSPDQQAAVDRALAWAAKPGGRDLTMSGLAGTGKTAVVSHVIGLLPQIRVMAPTGRAAQVLRRKGVPARTVHSVIYDYLGTHKDERTGEEFMAWRDKQDVDLPPLWCVDEASMITGQMLDDLRARGVPIWFVGDPGQLPPVGGVDPQLMVDADVKLTTIHRLAEGSAILDLAHAARRGVAPVVGGDGAAQVRRAGSLGAMVDSWIRGGVDQVAVAYNSTRRAINARWRLALGHRERLVPGERLICLLNDRSRGVYNGTIMRLLSVEGETEHGWQVKVEDDGGEVRCFAAWNGALGGAEWSSEDKPGDHVALDYGYCITVHRAQGGEWDCFAVVDQPCRGWSMDRWRYTAYSRARKQLYVYV